MRRTIGVLLRACLVARLRQRTVDEAVLGIHDGRFRVVARFLLHTCRSLVAGVRQIVEILHALLSGHVLAQIVEHLTVVLQQLQRQVSGGVVLRDMFVGLQVFLDVGDTVLYLVTIVDVQVSRLFARAFIHLDHCLEEFLHALAALERGGNHRHTEQSAQHLQVKMVAATLELVIHVQRADHTDVHVYQLCGQIEVALQVRGIDHVDHHVGHLLREMFAHVELLRRVAAERVGAWQIGKVELIAEHRSMSLGGVDGHTAVVAHMRVSSAGVVEQRGLATVGIAYQCHVDRTAFLLGNMLEVVVLVE